VIVLKVPMRFAVWADCGEEVGMTFANEIVAPLDVGIEIRGETSCTPGAWETAYMKIKIVFFVYIDIIKKQFPSFDRF
jgi:hypothetical protein